MTKPVGGRGIKAPYNSILVRMPEPIKREVEELKNLFYCGSYENLLIIKWDFDIVFDTLNELNEVDSKIGLSNNLFTFREILEDKIKDFKQVI